MIGLVRGTIASLSGNSVIVDTGGVGYRVTITPSTMATLSAETQAVTLFTYTHVREDVLELFGFLSDAERGVFETLLGTHGVGPSLALAILGTLGASEVVRAVQEQDSSSFELVSGVGKKTAARLMLELQGSMAAATVMPSTVGGLSGGPTIRSDVAAALEALGYGMDEIQAATADLDGTESVEHGLRLALQAMGSR
jgi:holliday junction DNA helicase RuvA